MAMKKKAYKKPYTNTIMLRQQFHLLAGSDGVESERVGYTNTDQQTWE